MNTQFVVFLAFCGLIRVGVAQKRPNFSRFGENPETSSSRLSCSTREFRCRSGQCISSESLCDGRLDCIDGTDETSTECDKPESLPCNPRAFRCDYGACVDGDAVCNGVRDCADNSDELQPYCSSSTSSGGSQQNTVYHNATDVPCRRNQFRCDNGQCIASTEVCDGTIDCLDKSDETILTCGSFNCPQYVFRCAYGGCIDNNLKCNNVVDCADGSDEDRNLCGPSDVERPQRPDESRPSSRPNDNTFTTKPMQPPVTQTRPTQTWPTHTKPTEQYPPPTVPKNSCSVPPEPDNGEWKLEKSLCLTGRNCKIEEGVTSLVPGTQLVYECNHGYKINGSANVYCSLKGKWSHIPKCVEIRCPPLNSASIQASCTYEDAWASCDSPVKPRTIANLKCRNSYTQDTSDLTRRDTVKCNMRGEWEPKPIKCISVCGVATIGVGTPLVVNGTRAKLAEFPWHATLYQDKGHGKKEFFCGATIIRENLLITAAHCVYDHNMKRPKDASKLYIATGNIFRDWDYEGHDLNLVKKARVKNIFVVCNYLGLDGNYASDIAIVQIESSFTFSSTLMPVCLDTNSVSDQSALEVGNYGRVPGFGKTEKGSYSFILQTITLPYIPLNTCKAHSKAYDSERYITIDKFCAGYTNGSSVCDGDSGGGLVFKTDNHWYLRGIVSVGIGVTKNGAQKSCNSYSYSLYTRVSSHMEWIQDVISRLETNKPFHGCS